MAISEKQRQKKLAKKKEKRKSIVKSKLGALAYAASNSALLYSQYPIHECLIPVNLFETGLGNVIVARKTPEGNIAVSAFIVDVFCLGVKDAFFMLLAEDDYEVQLKLGFMQTQGCAFEKIHQSCAKKLLEGAIAYADNLGFKAHPDYKNAANILKGVDAGACPVAYVYGKDGKPFYISGPHESPARVEKIIDTLRKKCGDGGFDYIAGIGGDPFGEDNAFFQGHRTFAFFEPEIHVAFRRICSLAG